MKKTVLVLSLTVTLLFSAVAGAVEASSATENTWKTKALLPERLTRGVQAGMVNEKIYAMFYIVNYEYNPATDTWIKKTPMPTPRNGFGFAVYQNKIFTIGGQARNPETFGSINSYVNEVYDPATDTWETREPMPTGRRENDSSVRAAVVGDKIHVLGYGVHDIYDAATNSWTVGEPKPYPLPSGYISLTVFDSKIYIFYGNWTQIYDPTSDSWSLGAASPLWVSRPGVGATSGVNALKRIYLFGGFNLKNVYVEYTQVYDPVSDRWSAGAPMLTARAGPAVDVVDDTIFVIGGGIGGWFGGIGCDVTEQYTPFGYGAPDPSYTPSTNTVPPIAAPKSSPAVLFAAISVGAAALTIAGLLIYQKRKVKKAENFKMNFT